MYLIYKHTSPSGKSYIGQTNNYKERFSQHQKTGGSPAFHKAIKKHGAENFTHEILHENLTLDEANHWEEFYIREHKTLSPNGYNLTSGGSNPFVSDETKRKMAEFQTGRKMSDETKAKISAAHMGKKHSPERVEKMRISKTGVKMSEEFKAKMSIISSQRICTPETRAKLSAANKGENNRTGTKHTAETKAKISAAHMGKIRSPESIEKTRQGNLGRKQSAESIAKAVLANTGKKRSDETKARMSAARIAYELKKKLESHNPLFLDF